MRNILGFDGIAPVRETLIGSIETCREARHCKGLEQLCALGRAVK